MIKKLLLSVIILNFIALSMPTGCCDYSSLCDNLQLVFKQGCFIPHDKPLRCMLAGNSHNYGAYMLEGAIRYRLIKSLFAELNGSWFKHDGCSMVCTINQTANGTTVSAVTNQGFGQKFRFELPTFGFGLKYFYDFCNNCMSIFAGAGGKAFFMRATAQCSESHCCTCDSKKGVGGFVGTGIQYKPSPCWLLEGFVDYNIKTLKTSTAPCCSYSYCLDVGGIAVGIGIGCAF